MLLEEMNKKLIVYMRVMILCMLKMKELRMMLKEMVVFFVLQLLEIVTLEQKTLKLMNYSNLNRHSTEFQFSVSGIRFSKN